jgi:hypothetical protein
LRAQSGQLILEAILIIVICMAVTFTTATFFKDKAIFKQVISGPWKSLAGMLQNGVWGTPEKTAISHPNGHFRHIVIIGETSQ